MNRKVVIVLFLLSLATMVKAQENCSLFSAAVGLRELPKKKETSTKNPQSKKKRVNTGTTKPSELIYQYGQVFLSSAPSHQYPFTQIPVKNGDVVRTGNQSFAVIKTANGSQLRVLSNSHVYLKSINHMPIQIELKQGRVDASVRPSYPQNKPTRSGNYKFLLNTPSLNLGVRGTQFTVAHHADESKVSVNHGIVDIRASNVCGIVTELQANEGASATKAGANKIKLLGSPDLSRVPKVFKGTHVPIQFGGVAGVDHYRIQVAHDSEFIYSIKEQLSQQSEFKLEGLDNGYYYIKVIAVDNHGVEGIPSKIRILFQYN